MTDKKELKEEELKNVSGGIKFDSAKAGFEYLRCKGCGEFTRPSVSGKCMYCGSTDLEKIK